jgi:hypothetical protein
VVQTLVDFTAQDKTCSAYVKLIPFDTSAYVHEYTVKKAQDFAASGYLRNIALRGDTAIFDSLCQVVDALTSCFPDKPTQIDFVLLTDGEDNSSGAEAKQKFVHLESLLKSSNSILKCICFVLTTNSSANAKFVQLLKDVMPSGSEVISVSDGAHIPRLMKDFAEATNKTFLDLKTLRTTTFGQMVLQLHSSTLSGQTSAADFQTSIVDLAKLLNEAHM